MEEEEQRVWTLAGGSLIWSDATKIAPRSDSDRYAVSNVRTISCESNISSRVSSHS